MLNKLTYLIYPSVIPWLQALDDVNLYNYISDQNEHIMFFLYYYTSNNTIFYWLIAMANITFSK